MRKFLFCLFAVLTLSAMKLPCQSLGRAYQHKEIVTEIRKVRERITRTSQTVDTTQLVIEQEVVEVLVDGQERIRLREQTIGTIREIMDRPAGARTPAENQAILSHMLAQEQAYSDRPELTFQTLRDTHAEKAAPILISTLDSALDMIASKGDLPAVAEGLLRIFDQLRVTQALKITIRPDAKRALGFSIITEPTLSRPSACALGDLIGRNSKLVGDIAKLFSVHEKVTEIELSLTQSSHGISSLEAVTTEVEAVSRVESRLSHMPPQSRGVSRDAYAPVYVADVAYVSTGVCYCPYGY